MEIDVHGMRLWEAIDEIIYCLEECRVQEVHAITIIHGYHHGRVLKDYIQSRGFIREMKREGFHLKKHKSSRQGATTFLIR